VPAGNDDIGDDVAKALDALLQRNIYLAAEKAERNRYLAAQKAAAEKAAAEKAAAEKKAAAAKKAADEKAAAEKAAAEKAAAEKAAAEKKAAAAKKAADEKAAAEKAAAEKAAAEKAAAEKAANEARVLELEEQLAAALATARELKKAAAEKAAAANKAAAEKAAAEKAAAEKAAAEKAEKEKAEREKAEREKAEREKAAEKAAADARILDLEKQLAAALAMAKAITESSWWPWRQEAMVTPMASERAPPSERRLSERARPQKNAADQMVAAELFWKTRYRFSVPHAITEQMTNHVKSIVRSRLLMGGVPFEEVYPQVVLSYASGRRPQDCEGAGPGMFYAADLLEFLHERRVPAFSGLHVPPGKDWRCYMLRLEGRRAQAKVLVVLLTEALYQSKPCLQEINAAIENQIPLIPSASLALPIPSPLARVLFCC